MSYQMIFLNNLLFELFLSFWFILQIAVDVVNFILIEFYCVFFNKKKHNVVMYVRVKRHVIFTDRKYLQLLCHIHAHNIQVM